MTAPRIDADFLRYYAGVLTREADARPGQTVQWMRDGAARALREAETLSAPRQADLFSPQIDAQEPRT